MQWLRGGFGLLSSRRVTPANQVALANNSMKRQGQPFEISPAFVFLASDDSRYMTGQTIHINGGQVTSS